MSEIVFESLKRNQEYIQKQLHMDLNFDILFHTITIGEKQAAYYFIDGFCKDEIMEKINEYFIGLKAADTPQSVAGFLRERLPYPEIGTEKQWDKILISLLSGVVILLIDGFEESIYIDARTYPARNVTQPDKEKTLRGAKDGFVETIVFNTALLRRRIRSRELIIEMKQAGEKSRTDIAICYMVDRVEKDFLKKVVERIERIQVEALTVSQESLAECLYPAKWYNPFPKFRYTERPDVACAQLMEGNIIIITDNSPFAMILPASLFDILEEVDDYYFPPVTGTYLRITRFLIGIFSFFTAPTFLLLVNHPQWIPKAFLFIQIKETVNIPVVIQFLILEIAIDGLKLAAVNTPNMLNTPLSIVAALVLGEFSVNSGWFNSEVMLYMAFIAISNYTQSSYEFGYAVKFFRIITLILTALFGIWGYGAGCILYFLSMIFNRTISGKFYLWPLIPFCGKKLKGRIFRHQIR